MMKASYAIMSLVWQSLTSYLPCSRMIILLCYG
jgi:hypothetical protein